MFRALRVYGKLSGSHCFGGSVGSRTGRNSLHKGALPFPCNETLFFGCPSLNRVARRSKLFTLISYSMIFLGRYVP